MTLKREHDESSNFNDWESSIVITVAVTINSPDFHTEAVPTRLFEVANVFAVSKSPELTKSIEVSANREADKLDDSTNNSDIVHLLTETPK
jgi:hypothetical protein